jgi:hypothetical protein
MFELETHDNVALLRMVHGKANSQDIEFCNGIIS